MKKIILIGLLFTLFACGGNAKKKKSTEVKTGKDTLSEKPEGFKSAHQRDKEAMLRNTIKKKKNPVRIKF